MLSCIKGLLPAKDSASTFSQDSLIEKQPLDTLLRVVPVAPHRYSPLTASDARERLQALRQELTDNKLTAYVVPTADAHGSEYVGDCDKRRAWLSGFTGSAGVAIVTHSSAHLFTDSRYYTQATHELDPSLWTLEKVGTKGVKNWDAWLEDGGGELEPGARVGVDPSLIDYSTAINLSQRLHKRGLALVFPPDENLIDRIWADRPSRSCAPINLHPLKFAGEPAASKLAALRAWLAAQYPATEGAPTPSFLLSSLPAIAWLLNLRGGDIAFNPVFYGYVLVHPGAGGEGGGVKVWVQEGTLSAEAQHALREVGAEVRCYDRAVEELKELARKGERVVADGRVSFAVAQAIGDSFLPLPASVPNPVDTAQAIKNPVEIEGFRRAYLRDGVAWVRWMAWLEEALVTKQQQVSEWDAAEKLTEYRKEGLEFAGLAYENISATGANAALPHYAPTSDSSALISLETPYLNDSGAQYHDGTIDTTRTYLFPLPSSSSRSSFLRPASKKDKEREKARDTYRRAYTRVLQGHAALDRLVFPEGTTGEQVDVLARWRLWGEGWDYGHGTGHGIGEYLSVHETQVGISHSQRYFSTPLLPGHITSNEPAFYAPGEFGIRLESVLCVREVRGLPHSAVGQAEGPKWYGFERMTVIPLQRSFVLPGLLSPEEDAWLAAHNQRCKQLLRPLLVGDKRARRWVERQ
ncbi:hypothetical protein JCM10207_002787 [Rhodosporidiobolus poonsookiae]